MPDETNQKPIVAGRAPDGVDAASRAAYEAGTRDRVWGTARRTSVELWTIAGMGHGCPVDAKASGGGRPGPRTLDAGVAAVSQIARFWGLSAPDSAAIPRR